VIVGGPFVERSDQEISNKKILFVTGTRADFGKLEPLALGACAAGHDVTFYPAVLGIRSSPAQLLHTVSGNSVPFSTQRNIFAAGRSKCPRVAKFL
jgi:hypothetical protein